MLALLEVVKTFDAAPFQAGDGDAFRFRLEVTRELGTDIYRGKVYRLETYRLQPTYPQAEGRLPDWKSDELIYVQDHMFDSDMLTGSSVQEIVEKFQKRFDDIFSASKPV